MNRKVVTANPDATIREASKVMDKLHIGSLVVVDNDKIVGIITSSDVLKAVAENKNHDTTTVEDIMSRSVIIVKPDKTIEDAVNLMVKHRIKKLPVVDKDKLIGIITASDIIVIEPKLIESIAGLVSIKLPGYRGG